jgi:hypothetical protein
MGPIRPVDLAKRMQMDASTLTRNLQPLSAMGLLTIGAGADAQSSSRCNRNRRVQTGTSTTGLKAAQLALNAQLGTERVAALHDLIDSCIECLDGDEGGDDAQTD